ncbi:MAG: SAM-dependent methyltransferase [Pseudomonadota bacterium]|nr:SAM-dependent methyltransferase [Pseudomonadota bacterium]
MGISPSPDPVAVQQSQLLLEYLITRVRQGFYPFDEFMQDVLYKPGIGYYSSHSTKLGSDGDFITAPETSPFFGRLIADLMLPFAKNGQGILELGAGTGQLALEILQELETKDALPRYYNILEVSANLRNRQQALLFSKLPHLAKRIHWLDHLPETFEGFIFGNEVLDALPCSLVRWEADGVYEVGVDLVNDSKLCFHERPLPKSTLLQEALKLREKYGLGQNGSYLSEINLAACSLTKTLASRLVYGALLFIDYGFGEKEYYHCERNQGTLMCHYAHQSHPDPFMYPGLQDITAHVNFSAIYDAAIHEGLLLSGYTTQAHFLINLGILNLLSNQSPASPEGIRVTQGVHKLLSPAEMGELFKVIAFTTEGVSLNGFNQGDLSRLL